MALQFRKATKTSAKLRMALIGISGTGKTYSALRIAAGLGGRIALIDTEHGRASTYAHKFDFDTLELENFHPEQYIEATVEAVCGGYDVLIVDSISHAWMGKDGALELVDKAQRAQRSPNSYTAWRDVTPLHNKLVETLTTAPLHLIVTMRSKTKYELEKDDKGKVVPRKVGLEPVQRDGLEYEFDLVGDLNHQHDFVISKSTLDTIHPMDVIRAPDEEFGRAILEDITGAGKYPDKPYHPAASEDKSLTPQQEAAQGLYNEALALRGTYAAASTEYKDLSKYMQPVKAIGRGEGDKTPGYVNSRLENLQQAMKRVQMDEPRSTLAALHIDAEPEQESAKPAEGDLL